MLLIYMFKGLWQHGNLFIINMLEIVQFGSDPTNSIRFSIIL